MWWLRMIGPVPSPFKFDEIGIWSELKLEIVEKYGAAYMQALKNQTNLKKFYIDGFCGGGIHVTKKGGMLVEGSTIRVLKIQPKFDHYYFIDLNEQKTDFLKQR